MALFSPSSDTATEAVSLITAEESKVILQKLQQWASGSVASPTADEVVYLEQQLSDILGCTVVSELEGKRLPFASGRIKALPHLKRFPTDTLSLHDAVLEAGLQQHRSRFGWFVNGPELTEAVIEQEQYSLTVPLFSLPNWSFEAAELEQFFRWRKVVIVNPFEALAVVGVIGDIGPERWLQYQCGAVPEVIRQLQAWSPKSQGRVVLFLVDDPSNEVQLGVRSLNQPLTGQGNQ